MEMKLFGIVFVVGYLLGLIKIGSIGFNILQRYVSRGKTYSEFLLLLLILLLAWAVTIFPFALFDKEMSPLFVWLFWIPYFAVALTGFITIGQDYIIFFKRKRNKHT